MNFKQIVILVVLLGIAIILIPSIPKTLMYGIAGWQIGFWAHGISKMLFNEEE